MKTFSKLFMSLVLMLGLVSVGSLSTFAAEGGSYESNGKISFYGEWVDPSIKPDEVKPTPDEVDPDNPTEVTPDPDPSGTDGGTVAPPTDNSSTPSTGNSSTPSTGNSSTPSTSGGKTIVPETAEGSKTVGKLPQTGSSSTDALYYGLGALALGALILFLMRRKKESIK